MRIENIEYFDYDGTQRSEKYYFNLGRKELTKLNFMYKGGVEAQFKKLSEEEDMGGILDIVDNIIKLSIGQKSEDGRHFKHDKEFTEEFMDSAAYDALYGKLMNNVEYFNEFIRSIIPNDLLVEAERRGAIPAATEDAVEEEPAKIEAE